MGALTRAGAHVCAYTCNRRGYCGTMYISINLKDYTNISDTSLV